MTDEQYRAFQERARRIAARNPAPGTGLRDGRMRLVLRFAMLVVLGALGFKAGLIVHLGDAAYDARVAALAEGGATERAGAVLMARDPLTDWLAQTGRRFVRHD